MSISSFSSRRKCYVLICSFQFIQQAEIYIVTDMFKVTSNKVSLWCHFYSISSPLFLSRESGKQNITKSNLSWKFLFSNIAKIFRHILLKTLCTITVWLYHTSYNRIINYFLHPESVSVSQPTNPLSVTFLFSWLSSDGFVYLGFSPLLIYWTLPPEKSHNSRNDGHTFTAWNVTTIST